MVNKKKKQVKRPRAEAHAHNEQQAAKGEGRERSWHIIGRDALDWGFYPLPHRH